MINEVSAYHISSNPSMYTPVLTNHFRVLIHGLDHLLRLNEDPADEASYITNAQEVIDMSVVSFNPPSFSQAVVKHSRGNSVSKFPGKPDWKDTQLVIADFVAADGKSILKSWQALSYNVEDDTVSRAEKCRVPMTVMEYLPDGTLVRYWELKNCWLSGVSEDAFQSEGGTTIKKVTAQVVYDRAKEHVVYKG